MKAVRLAMGPPGGRKYSCAMKLYAWGQTDVGRKRDHNEDSFLVAQELGLFVIADGMGGHQGGDRASRLAVDIMRREVDTALQNGLSRARVPTGPIEPTGNLSKSEDPPPAAAVLRDATEAASHAIFDLAQADPQLQGMGTTLTALFVHRDRAYLGHV